jgi:hypothetical protein
MANPLHSWRVMLGIVMLCHARTRDDPPRRGRCGGWGYRRSTYRRSVRGPPPAAPAARAPQIASTIYDLAYSCTVHQRCIAIESNTGLCDCTEKTDQVPYLAG